MKKLGLKKISIAKLSNNELLEIKGGKSEWNCSSYPDNDQFCAVIGDGPIDFFMDR